MEPEIKILQSSLFALKKFMAWPGNSRVNWKYWLKFAVLCIIGAGTPCSVVMHIVLSIKYNEELSLKEDLALLVSINSGLYMTICFIVGSRQLKKLFRDLSSFTDHGEPEAFIKTRNRLNFISAGFFIYVNLGSTAYGVASYFGKNACEKMKLEKNLHETCGLFIKSIFPFDVEYFPVFQIIFILQTLSPVIYLNPPAVISVLLYECVEYLILKLNQLRVLFSEVPKESDAKIQEKKLKACIKYHQLILRIGEKMSDQFKYILVIHVFIASFTCAITLSQITDKASALIHLAGWMLALLFVCHAGQRLQDESSSLGERIMQESNWYTLKPSLQKMMQLMVLRSQKPMQLSAGPWAYVSYLAFIQVNKAAYSYYTLISARA